jgi:hypothetical protein
MTVLKPLQRRIRFCLPPVLLAVLCSPATWSQPVSVVWDTGDAIQADIEDKDIALPIKVTDGPQPSDGIDLDSFDDWDHWIQYDQGEQVDEGDDDDGEGLIQWSTQGEAWVDPTSVWASGTTWYAPSDGGKYWIKAVVDDRGEIGEGEYGTRDDDPITVTDPPSTHAIAVEVTLPAPKEDGECVGDDKRCYWFAADDDLGPTTQHTVTQLTVWRGFYKRVEFEGTVIPDEYTGQEDDFSWHQQKNGETWENGVRTGDYSWDPDDYQDEECFTTKPNTNHKIYALDWPGYQSGGPDKPDDRNDHTFEYVGHDTEEPFEFQTRVKFHGQWCQKTWTYWTRELRMESNAGTGYEWRADTNE